MAGRKKPADAAIEEAFWKMCEAEHALVKAIANPAFCALVSEKIMHYRVEMIDYMQLRFDLKDRRG